MDRSNKQLVNELPPLIVPRKSDDGSFTTALSAFCSRGSTALDAEVDYTRRVQKESLRDIVFSGTEFL
jgi:hypothetical protein